MMDRRSFLKYMGVASSAAAFLKANPAWASHVLGAPKTEFVLPPGGPPYPAGPYPSGPYPTTDASAMMALQNVKYTDPFLAAVPKFIPTSGNTYDIQMAQTTATVSSAFGNVTKVYAYGQQANPATLHYPGYSFDINQGVPITVNYYNNLPNAPHLLPTDPTIDGATVMAMTPRPYPAGYALPAVGTVLPENRATVHLHGAEVLDGFNDGWPDWWTVPVGSPGITAPNTQTVNYINSQAGCCLWYHDHGMATTRLNVHAGLAGFYFIRDAVEMALNIPRPGNQPAYEVPMVIQDRMFDATGQFLFPHQGSGGMIVSPTTNQQPTWPSGHPFWVPEYFGDVAVVNGVAWPNMNVEARKYRFRMLNGCNARFLNLTLRIMDPVGSLNYLNFHVIGTDQGLLGTSQSLSNLFMIPASRFDVILDFHTLPVGTVVYMYNDAAGPFPGGGGNVLNEIMSFTVGPVITPDTTVIPAHPDPSFAPIAGNAVASRYITLNEWIDPGTASSMGMQLGEGRPPTAGWNGLGWDKPVTITPTNGTNELWYFINRTGDAHPMHLHLVRFQVTNRYFIDAATFDSTGKLKTLYGSLGITQSDVGWKDTVIVPPGDGVNTYQVTVIKVPFPAGMTGIYPYHCHIIDHEDSDMMRYFQVA